MNRVILILSLVVLLAGSGFSQTKPSAPFFVTPDTVCVGQEVNIVNIITGSSYYWNFCTGNAGYAPETANYGNPGGLMTDPMFITLVKDSLECYSFLTSPGNAGVIRNYHGDSYFNVPISSSVGSFGVLTSEIRGIQVEKDNGTWYGFVANGTTLLRMVFVNGLANLPSVVDINFPNVTAPTGLEILKDGTNWYGFCLDAQGNSLNRLDFGTTLQNIPTVTNLGNIGQMDSPSGLAMRYENGGWYMLVCNEGSSTLTRISFGNSLANAPAGTNLGNVGGLNGNTGITLIQDCDRLNGYVVNHAAAAEPLIHLEFDGGVAGNVTGTPVGNPSGFANPYGISQLLRVGDTIYGYATNTGNSTLSLIYFPICSASSMPSYSGATPPPITYSTPGNYNIILTVNEGTALQTGSCNNIVVVPALTVSLGPDLLICDGTTASLDAGPGYESYLWNTGSTGQTIATDTAGTFDIYVTNRLGCEARDTAVVTVTTSVLIQVDTSVCYGLGYFAGGQEQTVTGTYYDSLLTTAGCDSIIVTELLVKDSIAVDIGNDTVFCPGDMIILNASTPGATYEWQNGSTDSLFLVSDPGIYWVRVTREGCTVTDSATVSPCPVKIFFPTAFTPNNDGLNDTFRPRGISIGTFRMEVYDRWGQKLFETENLDLGWNGIVSGTYCEPGTYTYVAWYSPLDEPGRQYKITGTVTLVR